MSNKMKPSKCLNCGKVLDAATCTDRESAPTPGSLSVCAYCSAVSMFDENLKLRPLTEAEVEEIFADPELAALLYRSTRVVLLIKAAKH
jgi:hypothetical protein